MALTGKLEVFPLPEVLRLLARSGRNGCLRIDAGPVDGRIYLNQGALTLATVSTDAELLDQLVSSGVIDGQRIERMAANEIVLPDVLAEGRAAGDLTDFIREHVVESLYRIRRPGAGAFEFLVDAASRFDTGQTFDTEIAVSEAERRGADWADIEQTIADMHLPVRMVRELRDNEVTVNAPTWRVLAALEGGASIFHIARELGTTEFQAAREIAGLLRAGLIEEAVPPTPTYASQAVSPAAEPSTWFQDETPAPAAPAVEEPAPVLEHSPWTTDPDPEPAPTGWDDQPWARPAEETGRDQSDDSLEAAEELETSGARGGWWAEAMGTAELDPASTDEFLESVFSEAEGGTEPDEEETGFSMGLLRRRRMGPAARDLAGE